MVNGEEPDAEQVRQMDLSVLYKLSEFHLLTGIVGYALEAAGVDDHAFRQANRKAIRKAALLDTERAAVLEEMEKAGIWYMPLKGCALKEMYPQVGMRQMSDNDILFDAGRADDVKAIMEQMDYSVEYFGKGNHDVYHKKPVCNFEMHRALFGEGHEDRLQEYYRNVKDRLVKDEGNRYGFHFTLEDFYIYMTAHEYKHYSGGGTGLRSLLDTYVYLRNVPMDMSYVEAEVRKLGIDGFEKANRSLALGLFGGGERSEEDREMLEYILSSGTYGTVTHRIENDMQKHGWGKFRYMLHRFSVPVSRKNKDYDAFASAYPLFYKHKILLPALLIYRPARAMWEGRFRAEAKAIRNVKGRK
jgi:hypothetical protein